MEPETGPVELPASPRPSRSAPRVIAIGGGKGGAGKSLLAANIGIFLSTLGKRVVLLDADLGGANLHTFVGVERPRMTLADLFEKKVGRIEDVVVDTPIPGLGLVCGEGDPGWATNARPAQKLRLLNQAHQLDADYVVVDLGPGAGWSPIDFFNVADTGVLVVVPEPTSVENTYRFVKSAFLRRVKRAGIELPEIRIRAYEGGLPGPLDLLQALRESDPAQAERLFEEMKAFRPKIVVNQVRARSDLELGAALVSASRRRLGLALDFLGDLEHDDAVWLAVRKRRPLLVEHTDSRVAKGVERVTRRLLGIEQETVPSTPLRPPTDLNHYETLEIDPAASDEEIRRAHRRVREVYGADSLVVCGLYDRERLAALHLRIEEAYDTLMDAERRKAYDLALFPDEQPRRRPPPSPPAGSPGPTGPAATLPDDQQVAAQAVPMATEAENTPTARRPLPPEPELPPGTDVTGGILRRLREARGVDIYTISHKTKIHVGHLRAIEDERFDKLPAVVYVRGFLIEYAKYLRIDPKLVLDSYLVRYRDVRAELDGERG